MRADEAPTDAAAPDGLRWYALSVRRTGPVTDQIEAIAVLSDITRLKAQQVELEQLARDRELMFSLSEVGIAFLRDGLIQRANDALAQLAGYPAVELHGLPLATLFPDPAESERLSTQEENALRQHGRWIGERQLHRGDGRRVWVQVSTRLVGDDPAGGVIASFVNVDARHRAEHAVALQANRTRAILDSVLVGIVTVGPGGIEWMNRSARRMFGADLGDFIDQPMSTVATPEPDHPFRRTQYLEDLVEGEAETFECRVKARDGREFWIVGNAVVTVHETRGRQLTYALLDIERRRQAEARIEEAQASLQRIIEAAPMAITVRDARSLRILQANVAAARSVDLTNSQLIGRTPEEIFTADVAAQRRVDMEHALRTSAVTQREYQMTVHGDTRVWDARYMPLAAPGQEPDQLLLVATDVTEQRAAEQAKFDAAIAQREMLVKEVHHRIKNNLQGVAGLLQQIASRKPEMASAMAEVVGQVQAIAQVYGLQVGSGGPLQVIGVVEAIAASVQRTFGHPIGFSVQGADPKAWVLPEAESIPIALTLNELLTNAVKHSAMQHRTADPTGDLAIAAVDCSLICEDTGVAHPDPQPRAPARGFHPQRRAQRGLGPGIGAGPAAAALRPPDHRAGRRHGAGHRDDRTPRCRSRRRAGRRVLTEGAAGAAAVLFRRGSFGQNRWGANDKACSRPAHVPAGPETTRTVGLQGGSGASADRSRRQDSGGGRRPTGPRHAGPRAHPGGLRGHRRRQR